MGGVNNESDQDRALRERFEKISGAIEKKLSESGGAGSSQDDQGSAGETSRAIALGFRILSELVAGVLVGAFIGWQLDQWLGTKPWFLIVFLGLGIAAGFWNMVRAALKKTVVR
jgi:ATP synthase protein I